MSQWTPERRSKQAAAIKLWKPWRRSTGPVTEAGKLKASANSVRHGEFCEVHNPDVLAAQNLTEVGEHDLAAKMLMRVLRSTLGDDPVDELIAVIEQAETNYCESPPEETSINSPFGQVPLLSTPHPRQRCNGGDRPESHQGS